MSGIIRWLAPHLFPQLQGQQATAGMPMGGSTGTPSPALAAMPMGGAGTPNPIDASVNAVGNWAFSGAPGSPTAPGANQQAIQDVWNRFAPLNKWPGQRYPGQGQWMQPPTPYAVPQSAVDAVLQPSLPPLSAPPAPHDLHPASIRLDFHKPPEPPEQDPLSSLHFLHPGIGATSPAPPQRSTLPWPAGPGSP